MEASPWKGHFMQQVEWKQLFLLFSVLTGSETIFAPLEAASFTNVPILLRLLAFRGDTMS